LLLQKAEVVSDTHPRRHQHAGVTRICRITRQVHCNAWACSDNPAISPVAFVVTDVAVGSNQSKAFIRGGVDKMYDDAVRIGGEWRTFINGGFGAEVYPNF
jgi:hypothetical protein